MPDQSQFTGGLQAPLQANGSGGFRRLEGDEYLSQTIAILCGSGESDNPFNDGVGVGASAIFANASDLAWRAKTRREIEDVFRDLERARLAKLRSVDFLPSEDDPAETVVSIRYLSIETNTEQEVQTSLRRA